jgi:hypothetical protein
LPHEVEALAWKKLSEHYSDSKRRSDIMNLARFDGDFELELSKFYSYHANNLQLMSDFAMGIGFGKLQGWLANARHSYQRSNQHQIKQSSKPEPENMELTDGGWPLHLVPNK